MLRYLLTLTSLFFIAYAYAQPNALVTGTIVNTGPNDAFISAHVNQKYLTGITDDYYSNILEDGSFAFALEMNEPQLISIAFNQNRGYVYLEPGDTLNIDCTANNFQFSFKFSGKSKSNNEYLVDYYKINPTESNAFKLVQYKQNQFWYTIAPLMDNKMRDLSTNEFISYLASRRQDALSHLFSSSSNLSGELSKDFIDYINSEINYDWAYHMMAHGNIYKKIKEINEEEYYSFLTSTKDMKGRIGNQHYRQFLLAKIDRAYSNVEEKASNPYLGQYNFAAEHNVGEQKSFLQSEMIVKAFSKKYISETIPLFESFLSEANNDEFGSKVVEAYEKSLVNAIGTKASNFVIRNPGETEVSLSSLTGKTIYLNFWASWCRPCMKKMNELKPLEVKLKEDDIEFIHISFDKNEDAWKNAIKANGFSGTHVIVPEGVDSSIAKEYEIRSIPQYFIIDKDGNFATKPTVPSVKELQKVLEKTSKM